MRILIAAVGRLKDAEEKAIFFRYATRLAKAGRAAAIGPLDVVEVAESRAPLVDVRRSEEATRLLQAIGPTMLKVALHGKGETMTSEHLAKFLKKHADTGVKTCGFLIGGPDGHGEEALLQSNAAFSMGPLTFPHGLARIILAEQLYRAATIVTGHPYHRA